MGPAPYQTASQRGVVYTLVMALYVISGIIAGGLLVYLFVAMLKPEWVQ
jgi:K+-transporting ATPase KdpF subunit